MSRTSPLYSQHQLAEALFSPYGPEGVAVPIVQTFGVVEVEYAAIRKSTVLIDEPQRACIEISGPDRVEFLNRMLTQELKGFAPFSSRSSFWLSRKGRIDADLRLVNLTDRVLVDVDTFAAQRTVAGLSAYVITEDVKISDVSTKLHRLSLHGPTARATLAKVTTPVAGPVLIDLGPNQACIVEAAGPGGTKFEIAVDRFDMTGEVGLGLAVPIDAVGTLYDQILEAGGYVNGHSGERPASATSASVRPAGWAAFNTARIEAGTPLYYLDFGPDSLPAETGVLDSRVSFTKGCYLGQEIVARMHSLGSPKQVIVCLRMPGPKHAATTDATADFEAPIAPQPITGAAVFAASAAGSATDLPRPSDLGDPVGAITSSAISPMLGGVPLCFAMLKFRHAIANATVMVECEGELLPATVQPKLAGWTR